MKNLSAIHMVETTRKGGSKKLYFSVQRDMLKMVLDQIKTSNDLMISPALKKLPSMIKKCKIGKTNESKELTSILDQYYISMVNLDKLMKKLDEATKKVQKEVKEK